MGDGDVVTGSCPGAMSGRVSPLAGFQVTRKGRFWVIAEVLVAGCLRPEDNRQ